MRKLKRLNNNQGESKRYKLWLSQSKFDLEAAEISFNNGFYEWTAYQGEQAVEKSLKSVILHAGYIPPKIHKLSVLIGYSNNLNKDFSRTKFEFRDIDAYTYISRYPFLLPDVDKPPHEQIRKEDARKILDQAIDIVLKINNILEKEDYEVVEEYELITNELDLDSRLAGAVEKLEQEFNPTQIILFGGYARNPEQPEDKTVDLMIIADTDLPFLERMTKARKAVSGFRPIIEPIVYTQKEFDTLKEGGEGFLENALNEGRIIYSNE